jgi:phosphate starvation-inducible protein PhoH
MQKHNLEELIAQVENYLECLKQFNQFLIRARDKKFNAEEESQFLELKSVLIQQLEMILSVVQSETMTRDDVHNMISMAPSLRALGEFNDGTLRGIESQWHKIFIAGQCILGQLKVKQRDGGKGGGFFGFGKT